jgi:hypothetical protein
MPCTINIQSATQQIHRNAMYNQHYHVHLTTNTQSVLMHNSLQYSSKLM